MLQGKMDLKMNLENDTVFLGNQTNFVESAYNGSIVSNEKERIYSFEPHLFPEPSKLENGFVLTIIAYSVIFVIGTSANILAFISLWRKYRRSNESRIFLLLLHLTSADLIVCCTLLPTEIFWRLTIHWWGGNILCKVIQFSCTFGLYLSSLVLICVSVDRFLAIRFPMTMLKTGAYRRVKVMLAMAWMCAAVFSIPQAVFFSAESYPEYPGYQQCVTNDFESHFEDVKIYSIFSLVVMYFIPLTVILFTYTAIFLKLARKSHQRAVAGGPSRFYNLRVFTLHAHQINHCHDETSSISVGLHLRYNSNAESSMSRAKTRSLVMTILFVVAFVVCWTPYAFMNLWYMLDWKRATLVDPLVQDALFLMAVANSCINPVIYSRFSNDIYSSSRRIIRGSCLPR